MRNRIGGSPAFPVIPPVGIAMPVDETDEFGIDFIDKAPDPIPPEGLEALHGRASDTRAPRSQAWTEPAQDGASHVLIDVAVLREAQVAADPVIVRLVPDTPVPSSYALFAPFLQAVPHDITALLGEPADRPRIVDRPAELREGHHRRRAHGEHGIDIGTKHLPFDDRIGRVLIVQKDANDLRPHLSQAPPNALALGSPGEMPPAIGLVDSISETHTRHRRAVHRQILSPVSLLAAAQCLLSHPRRHQPAAVASAVTIATPKPSNSTTPL